MKEPRPVLVFDMDGVLVDVTDSYRTTVVRTVEHFTNKAIDPDTIQDFKNQGGWNDDIAVARHICAGFGVALTYDEVARQFYGLFLGPNEDGEGGLIRHERWTPQGGLLERLARRFQLAIFSGRLRKELDITLRRFSNGVSFDPQICTDDVRNGKPAPDGLLMIAAGHPGAGLYYVGDTVDDSRAAKAAGVPFYGVAAAGNPRREELAALFRADGAAAVLENVNELEEVLP
jgi:HAD superfamily hydrolase (TIGR01548 family)